MGNSRREFIKNGLTFVSLGMAAPAVLARAAADTAPGGEAAKSSQGKVLVVLQMFGGNDGLNTVIPYTDPLYYQNRPVIGIPRTDVLPISSKIGFHPAMSAMQKLYQQGHLAVVQGVGYPNPNLSHFRSTAIWETADPVSTIVQEGWLGRYFDDDGHLRENPLAGINFGAVMPRTLNSDYGSVVSMQNPATYGFQPIYPMEKNVEVDAFTALYSKGTMASSYDDLVRKTGHRAYTSSEIIHKALRKEQLDDSEAPLGSPSSQTLDAPAYPGGIRGGLSPLAKNLKSVAQLIAADMGTTVFYVSQGGFDTHANQPPTQAQLLQDLSESLAAFYADLKQRGLLDRVMLITFSEFGRRVQQNASNGTDHGTASCLFVMGGRVNGGLHGEYPALDDLDFGNLKFTTDFRDVYATALDEWLGVSSQKVLSGSFKPLRLLA